ncbi:hypothetical protein [Paenibacillus contaminans]|uniref:NodB homology domain-containing protein n=1 Tax=Paenibacillus contaminans TaxID=450362 RepID=A0A329M0S6_9BACL|nr:hypothetical protein [Paenibacillus contaminans]RAV13328.1 hypothetical protein DQG23_33520 [Paenibacillus contaminans]
MKMARVALLLDTIAAERRWKYGVDVFEAYVGEMLKSSGIPYSEIHTAEKLSEQGYDVVIAALSEESEESIGQLLQYAEQGGTLISSGGLNRMAGRLSCREIAGEAGYAEIPEYAGEPLRYLKAKPWLPVSADGAHAVKGAGQLHRHTREGEPLAPAILEISVGKGKVIRWNVDIPYTIVGFQQGTGPVVEDGIPAPDGTGSLDEGILKADDRCEMDWELDRKRTETGYPYYAYPYADWWRDAWVSVLLKAVVAKNMTLPFVDYWPDGVERVAMISHDSDVNADESAYETLSVLKECDVRSTWCMIEPGYSPDVYEQVKAEGHELAFHYNALHLDKGFWAQTEFERQLAFIREKTGVPIVSNKNHYTRVEGWGELFEWCERNGIRSDQTRGPSKKGNVGFLFGTCRPYYPIARFDDRNRLYNVLEIGFLTQDLEHPSLPDTSVITPFLETAAGVRGGVAHFLFHQYHILNQAHVADALREVVGSARKRNFTFWTGEQIFRWEESRRAVSILPDESEGYRIERAQPGTVVWVPVPDGAKATKETNLLFGVTCERHAVTAEASV